MKYKNAGISILALVLACYNIFFQLVNLLQSRSGWSAVTDVSQGLELSDDETDFYESGHLMAFSPFHVVMAHNLVYNDTAVQARQLWRKLDVDAKTFGLGMEAGTVSYNCIKVARVTSYCINVIRKETSELCYTIMVHSYGARDDTNWHFNQMAWN